jgi:hypothetical protein
MARRLSVAAVVAAAMVSAPAAGQTIDDQVRARQRISVMEGTLERAVLNGADNLLRQVRAVIPDAPMLTGTPEVRGFRLDGYGVFFDVEVPALRLPVTWPLRYISRENRALETIAAEFKSAMARAELDPASQAQFADLLRRLEMQAQGPLPLRPPGPAVATAGTQVATRVQVQIDPALIDDPNEGYTRAIKEALIDAMIESSGPLGVGPDEWLTIAARDNLPRDPLVPGDTADFSTLIFRLKGSDLAAFREGRVTLDEARKKVEVREY